MTDQCLYNHYVSIFSGKFEELPLDLRDGIDCPDYLVELPRASWLERLFGIPDGHKTEPNDSSEEHPRRRSLFRRIIDELF